MKTRTLQEARTHALKVLRTAEQERAASASTAVPQPRQALPVVMVNWWDAVSVAAAWSSQKDAEKLVPTLCHTVGLLLAETKIHIVVARSTNGCGEVGGVQAIHKCCIVDWGTCSSELKSLQKRVRPKGKKT